LEIACKVDNTQPGIGVLVPLGVGHHGTKCRMPPEPVDCAANAGNPGYRLGFDDYDDEFKISRKGDRVCAEVLHRRRRRNDWGLNLVLECEPSGRRVNYMVQSVHIGPSKTTDRCMLMTHKMQCDRDAGNPYKRINDHSRGDQFIIWMTRHNFLCARRTDLRRRRRDKNGWSMDLKIQCKQRDQLFRKVKVHIGKNTNRRRSHHKCVRAPDPKIECETMAGNPPYRLSSDGHGDRFHIEKTTLQTGWKGKKSYICARRTDKAEGWGLDLQIECKVKMAKKNKKKKKRRRSGRR